METKRILIVEDEASIRQMLQMTLQRAGFETAEAADVAEARARIANAWPDLILLDWMLPGLSGIDFMRELRDSDIARDIPIIMVSARGEDESRIRGLDLGCDDYIAKPFNPAELIARMRAVLRRTAVGGEGERVAAGDLVVDAAAQRVYAADKPVPLGPTEYRLLHFLIGHPDRVYSRERLLDRIWGQNVYVDERTVDVHIRRLRKALAPHGLDRLIQTVRGSGYRFSQQIHE